MRRETVLLTFRGSRHLSRPAHCLNVDNGRKTVSSFGIENDYGHPAAGLCRKCWRSFSDPEAFRNHANADCEIASRSKREKYHNIQKTFCQINLGPATNPTGLGASNDSSIEHLSDAEAESDDDMPWNALRAQSNFRGEDFVSRCEHNALVERVAALERMFQPVASQATPRTVPSQHEMMSSTLMPSSAAASTQQTQPAGHYTFDAGAQLQNAHGRPNYRDQTGSNMGTDRVMAEYHRSVSRRSDSMSTVHRTTPVTITHQNYESLRGQPKPAASDSAYATASNPGPTQSGGAANMISQPGMQVGAGVGEDDYVQEGISQVSSNTRLINQFMQTEEQREAVMGRANFFHPETDDISNFLNMDSQ
jgi:hypothetical protein